MSSADPHRRQRAPRAQDEDEDEDPVEAMISKTGCLEKHYAVQVTIPPPVTNYIDVIMLGWVVKIVT